LGNHLTENHFHNSVGVGKILTKKHFHNKDGSGKVTYKEDFSVIGGFNNTKTLLRKMFFIIQNPLTENVFHNTKTSYRKRFS